MSKVVFSSTLTNPLAWVNTRLVDPPGRGRTVDEGGWRPSVAHDRQPHFVPIVARGRPRRPLPGGRLPSHHRQHRAGADLRRIS
jgi:hypothetical protein